MRRTALRSKEMHTKYITYKKDPNFMATAASIVDYQHWRIIDNRFPYDTIAKTHHMLVPKRRFAEYKDMAKREHIELDSLINTYLEDYDAIMMNFPRQRSIPNWFHFHLMRFK